MTYAQAYCLLPVDAEWSSSFGNPGEGGYVEFYRCPNGDRWCVSNGPHDAIEPFEWTSEKLPAKPKAHVQRVSLANLINNPTNWLK